VPPRAIPVGVHEGYKWASRWPGVASKLLCRLVIAERARRFASCRAPAPGHSPISRLLAKMGAATRAALILGA
jgi:hypothetical protein